VLTVSAATDRRAYDALENGATLDSLLTDNPGKERHDEASLAADSAPPASAPEDEKPDLSDLSDAAGPEAPAAPAAPILIDAVLERAVQMQRTLLALGRLPDKL
jgi:hypothetical protein